ncbi:hypothetical protein M2275_000982 [Rhodococcus opacus]|nr:hypothetical protein [Rhodococcus opacus]
MHGFERPALTASGAAAALSPIPFGHATPNTVGFAHHESVIAALCEHGAGPANLPRLRFTPVAGVATFVVGRKEHCQFGITARGTGVTSSLRAARFCTVGSLISAHLLHFGHA